MEKNNHNVRIIENDLEKHIKRHKKLHKMLDELVADFLYHNIDMKKPKILKETSIMNLIKWSYQQTKNPQ